MKEPGFQEYIVNTPREDIAEIKDKISRSLATHIADRAFISLTISAINDGDYVTQAVDFQPTRVESEDSFISWGNLRNGERVTEASIRDEDDGMYLVVDATLDNPSENGNPEQIPTTV